MEEDVVAMELVPLEGEEGEGSFLGSICCQYSLGNLDASERRRKVIRKLKSKPLCHPEPEPKPATMLNE